MIDAPLEILSRLFSRAIFLTPKVRSLPENHWTFAFIEDPDLQLEVEATFEGRLIPQLSNIIKTQVCFFLCSSQVYLVLKFFVFPADSEFRASIPCTSNVKEALCAILSHA